MLFSQCTKCVDAVCLADRSVGSRRAEEIKAYVWPQLHRLRVLVIDTLRVVACIAQPAFQHAIAKACCHCECQVSAGHGDASLLSPPVLCLSIFSMSCVITIFSMPSRQPRKQG